MERGTNYLLNYSFITSLMIYLCVIVSVKIYSQFFFSEDIFYCLYNHYLKVRGTEKEVKREKQQERQLPAGSLLQKASTLG